MQSRLIVVALGAVSLVSACGVPDRSQLTMPPVPREIIDLGALVTENLPERVWGKSFMEQMGYSESNSFEVIDWSVQFPGGTVSGSNSYYTLFNHGGPHVDAPNHIDLGGGLESYPLEAFAGPLKVIDVSGFPLGRTVPLDLLRSEEISPGDIVVIYTAYTFPEAEDDLPHRIALTREAANYLATLPVRAFGTDAFNVDSDDNPTPVESDLAVERVAPNHYAFLSRGIPIYEQLFNVDQLLDRNTMYFVGVPLNIEDGDGMIVRPVVFVY